MTSRHMTTARLRSGLAHQATVILVVSVLLVRLLPFLSVTVFVVVTWVQGFLGLVDEAAAASDGAQSQLGHGREQGGS